ncbi:CoA-binding protein [Halopenitus sp. POP-27]|uniref:CoA-binding protein n=1 Tax=Halopenitus sp. POP-27 TaxID=2994425 RepID=UPI0024691DC5|nr:CoA-binding protein [Halopenitus sp. POP-27]
MNDPDTADSSATDPDATDPDPASPLEERIDALLDAETVAVVGCSSTAEKAAHRIPKYLQENGYRIVPVNPNADTILGEPAYDSLTQVPRDVTIDVVDVFRPSEAVPGVVDDVLERREVAGDVDGLWLQLGIRNDDAAERAAAAGIAVVQDRCMKVEHERLR